MESASPPPGAAALHLADGIALLKPDEQVLDGMLRGWGNQQLARNLAVGTIEGRASAVRAFVAFTNTFPWQWSAQLVDEWLGDLRSVRGLRRSTLRNYQTAVRLFCDFLTTRITAGPPNANGGSAPIRCRWCTSGTPRCTSRTPRAIRAGGR
ncbi:site-specific integrase [Amycolatopsis rubida]|uniref:site-specific integrase n=1 Tax=Amycolatopsis rubida TaxID=112413 RepID=UPI001FCC1F9F|nr:site-specific integrase [Amycolatopsis rubida]